MTLHALPATDWYTRLTAARRFVLPFLALPSSHPDRVQLDAAIRQGRRADDTNLSSTANPYVEDSASGAGWLLGWARAAKQDR